MGHVMGVTLEMIGMIVSKSFGSAYRAVGSYDGRRPRWQTVAAASVASALHVPTVVGSCYAFRAVMEVFNDDFFFIFGLFLFFPALLMVAAAVSGVAYGITVGVWLLIDVPGARWRAGFFATSGLAVGMYALYMGRPIATLVGWSTTALGLTLLGLVLMPRTETSDAPGAPSMPEPPPVPEPDPVPTVTLTQPDAPRGRFVL